MLKILKHWLEFRWGVCAHCKKWRTNIVWYFPTTCGYCDFMDGQ